jgi:hypothetical protein
MQCPDCGYDADDAAIFCPQCRFQFRDSNHEPAVDTAPFIDPPERGIVADESIFEEPVRGLPARELRLAEVQLLTPAILVVLTISLVTYTVVSTVPFIPLTLAGLTFGVTGILCLACGIAAGMVFFYLSRRSLAGFRYR